MYRASSTDGLREKNKIESVINYFGSVLYEILVPLQIYRFISHSNV